MSPIPFRLAALLSVAVMALAAPAGAQTAAAPAAEAAPASGWVVRAASVAAHEGFLASDALRGRGSATADEAVAAAYVAAMFQSYGLVHAPGMETYLQVAPVTTTTPSGHSTLTVGGVSLAQGEDLTVMQASNVAVSGRLTVAGDDPAAYPEGAVVLIAPADGQNPRAWIGAAMSRGTKLVISRQNEALKAMAARRGPPGPSITLADEVEESGPDVVLVSAVDYDRLKALAGQVVTLDPGAVQRVAGVTTNAIGYLPGNDPAAGVILVTAHLDHLGVRPDGVIMHGANDDASGTTAVLELAQALASDGPHRRGVLFVAYGSEEAGLLGSTYFGEHPPIPLTSIVANLEIEMIGAQDPQLPEGVMMMTGFDRSDFGPTLKARGALIGPDPYPEQNFFQRSDNYSLALQGIVAHTISGWATTPTYHDATDDLAHIDIPFMTQAIQSLIEPLTWMANGDFTPSWTATGRPTR